MSIPLREKSPQNANTLPTARHSLTGLAKNKCGAAQRATPNIPFLIVLIGRCLLGRLKRRSSSAKNRLADSGTAGNDPFRFLKSHRHFSLVPTRTLCIPCLSPSTGVSLPAMGFRSPYYACMKTPTYTHRHLPGSNRT